MPPYEDLKTYLSKANLYPDSAPLIPSDFIPTVQLKISYGDKELSGGNILRASACKTAPSISFSEETNARGASYTLLLIDPDAPTPDDRKFAYWRHWVIQGLKPAESGGEAVQTKPALTEYLGPGPKDESRPHRYLFLLFREPEGFSLQKEDVGGEEFVQRRSFRAPEWVERNGLVLVGLNWMRGVGDGWKED